MKSKYREKAVFPIKYQWIENPYFFLANIQPVKTEGRKRAYIIPKVKRGNVIFLSEKVTPSLSIEVLSKILKAENISFNKKELLNYAKELNPEEILTLSHFIKDFDTWLKENKLRAELFIRNNNVFIYIKFPMNIPDEVIDKKMSEAYKILYNFFETLTFVNIAADFIEKE